MTQSRFSTKFNSVLIKYLGKTGRIFLIAAFLIGAFIGLGVTYYHGALFSSRIVVESPFVNNEIMIGLTNDMRPFIQDQEISYTKEKLGISRDIASTLKDIEAIQIQENRTNIKVGSNRFSINIHTKTNDIKVIDSIFKGFLAMLESNAYIKNQLSSERDRISNYKSKIGAKIKEVEALQERSVEQIEVTKEFFSYYNYLIELYQKQSELDEDLKKTQTLIIIDKDSHALKLRPSYFKVSCTYAFISFFIVLGIIVLSAAAKTIDNVNSED